MKAQDLIVVVAVLLASFLPPAVYGYAYPNIGDDASVHVKWIESIQGVHTLPPAYWGQAIIGIPVKWLSDVSGASVLSVYTWMSYLVLALSCITIYTVASRLTSRWAGFIAIVIIVFASEGFMYLFRYGQIFDIVNMCIVLPIGILFLALWTKTGKLPLLIGTITAFLLFALFHPTGTYLPYCAGLYILLLIAWSTWHRRKKVVITSRLALRTSFALAAPIILAMVLSSVALAQSDLSQKVTEAISLPTFLVSLFGLMPLTLLLLALAVIAKNKPSVPAETSLAIGFLSATSIALAVASFVFQISPDPARQAFDLSIVTGLLTALLVGVAIESWKKHIPAYSLSSTDGNGNAKSAKLVCLQLSNNASRQRGN